MGYEHPGEFDQMIQEFRKMYAEWQVAGFPDTPSSVWGEFTCTNGRIRIDKKYAANWGRFITRSYIDQRKLKDFCKRNGLDCIIKRHDYKYSACDEVIITGTKEAFWKSELNGQVGVYRKRARDLQDLAQKFYESDMMKEVWKHSDGIHDKNTSYSLYSKHLWRINPYPCVIYNFNYYGYRDLQTEDEMIAFALAFCARDWKTDPKGISWEHLDWYLEVIHNSDGSMSLGMPRYRGTYLHEQPKVTEVPVPPLLKDFF